MPGPEEAGVGFLELRNLRTADERSPFEDVPDAVLHFLGDFLLLCTEVNEGHG
jgi:hypothetical protein